jgi:hypothetical protein
MMIYGANWGILHPCFAHGVDTIDTVVTFVLFEENGRMAWETSAN